MSLWQSAWPLLRRQNDSPVEEIVVSWRSKTLNRVLIVGVIVVSPAAAQTAVRTFNNPGERASAAFILGVYIAVVALAFLRRISPQFRGWCLVAALFGLGVVSTMRGGLAGDGRVYFMAFPILGLALLGIRPGLILTGLSLGTYAVFAGLAHLGILSRWLIFHDNSVSMDMWLYDGIVLLTLLCAVMVLLIDQYRFLMRTLRREQQRTLEVEKACAEVNESRFMLEQKVEERTAELAEANRVLQHLADHDALTGLPNRRMFIETLEHTLSLARRHHHIVAVAYLDLDEFKQVNDKFGHAQGDFFLQQVAGRISDCVRSSDTCARLSGDEFAVIFENLDSVDSVSCVAEKLLEVVKETVVLPGGVAAVSVSIGLAAFPDDGRTPEKLLHSADAAMYQVKKSSKGGYRFFSSPL